MLDRAAQSGLALCVAVDQVGPRELLALVALRGGWARVASPHELKLARAAGFAPERIAVAGPVLEDGLLRDALAENVAVIEAGGGAAQHLARIAAALGHAVPSLSGAPPALPAGAFRRVGGLLAQALQAPPELVLDAAWSPRSRARVMAAPLAHCSALRAAATPGTVRGLVGAPAPLGLLGPAARGDWLAVPDVRAAEPQAPHPAWPRPGTVLVRTGGWRLLDERPLPAGTPSAAS
ncbi:MAG: hypothetical protein ACT4PU_04555 [Planctomycetota bacterium]